MIALLVFGLSAYNLCLSIYPLDWDNQVALNVGANGDILGLLKASPSPGCLSTDRFLHHHHHSV
ncbi:MAG: hypothetical protein U0521_22205 [Anaerolineae bacterium]